MLTFIKILTADWDLTSWRASAAWERLGGKRGNLFEKSSHLWGSGEKAVWAAIIASCRDNRPISALSAPTCNPTSPSVVTTIKEKVFARPTFQTNISQSLGPCLHYIVEEGRKKVTLKVWSPSIKFKIQPRGRGIFKRLCFSLIPLFFSSLLVSSLLSIFELGDEVCRGSQMLRILKKKFLWHGTLCFFKTIKKRATVHLWP